MPPMEFKVIGGEMHFRYKTYKTNPNWTKCSNEMLTSMLMDEQKKNKELWKTLHENGIS